jgi:hypothetical protein
MDVDDDDDTSMSVCPDCVVIAALLLLLLLPLALPVLELGVMPASCIASCRSPAGSMASGGSLSAPPGGATELTFTLGEPNTTPGCPSIIAPGGFGPGPGVVPANIIGPAPPDINIGFNIMFWLGKNCAPPIMAPPKFTMPGTDNSAMSCCSCLAVFRMEDNWTLIVLLRFFVLFPRERVSSTTPGLDAALVDATMSGATPPGVTPSDVTSPGLTSLGGSTVGEFSPPLCLLGFH